MGSVRSEMSTDQELQEALESLMRDLIRIHDHKIELMETLCRAEVNKLIKKPTILPIVSLVNWVKSDLETVKGMTDTLLEIAGNLRRDVKRKRRNEESDME